MDTATLNERLSSEFPDSENGAYSTAFEGGRDEKSVLQHLLSVESQASVLVDDAQAEADRRVSENENENRARHEERFGKEAAELNSRYEETIRAAKEDYRKQLELYRESITALPLHLKEFFALTESLLFPETAFPKEP
ncbi:hypothetical protein TREPR_1146 [Treponema primitia ZAS-2]|uniref:Uncharacterized protein n=1 Tax=Treponema primitia (strain ATCC BAA-887 / DSM 12427 / ZAS-2) TaxID=545694 RepID=F5YH59_TREPZ|nr:hypothetical protein [Treponema primitia]AEF85127.1 hypothetical protein TREPR_1146 [Treponema primitia ZAS-2]